MGGMGRTRRQGTGREQGQRGVARVLALRPPWRLRGRPTFPLLVAAVAWLCTGERPELRGLMPHACLPGPAPP